MANGWITLPSGPYPSVGEIAETKANEMLRSLGLQNRNPAPGSSPSREPTMQTYSMQIWQFGNWLGRDNPQEGK